MRSFLPNTLFCYIFKRAIISFVLFLIVFSTVLVLVSFIQYADIFITVNVSFSDILKVLLLMFPLSLEFAIPLSVIVSLLYLIYVMDVNNEVLAIELTGFSRFILAYPILVFATLIFWVNLLFSLVLFPISITKIKGQAMNYVGHNIKNALRENKINDDIPDTVIYFKYKDDNERYNNLYVFQREENNSHLLIYSKEARFDFGRDALSIKVNMNNGKIIDVDGGSIRNIVFDEGILNINVADIVEKKVKNIRGFYGSNTLQNKNMYIYDSIYLSLVNIWVCLIGIIIFISKLGLNNFFRYVVFLILIGLYYMGFRSYHSICENGIMKVSEAFFSILLLMSLSLIFIKRIFVLRL